MNRSAIILEMARKKLEAEEYHDICDNKRKRKPSWKARENAMKTSNREKVMVKF